MSYKVFFSNDSLADIEKHRKSGKNYTEKNRTFNHRNFNYAKNRNC